MNTDTVKHTMTGLVVLALVLSAAVTGCKWHDKEKDTSVPPALWENAPAQVKIRRLTTNLIEGSPAESEQAEKELRDIGHQALYLLDAELEEGHPKEKERRITDTMVVILLKDASSVRDRYRTQAVKDLIRLDKRFGIIDWLLLRLETADQELSNSIFEVLELREYISANWSWADRAWDELSVRLANNVDVIKRYVTYKLTSLPAFDTKSMNWGKFDAENVFTVMAEFVIGEHYTDLAPLFAGMLDASEPRMRLQVARVLGHLSYAAAAPKLNTMLTEDSDDRVRAAAAEALGRLGAAGEAATTLIVLLRKRELLGSKVCWALGEMKAQKAVGALMQLKKQPAAMLALGKIGNELAVRPLARALESSKDPQIKIAAARALANFNTNQALQALKRAQAIVPSHYTRAHIIFAIYKIDPQPHRVAVEALLLDPDESLRLTAMILLTSKGSLRNLAKIMELIGGEAPDKRARFWETLSASFEAIPDYHPYGLSHTRAADSKKIVDWFNKNRARFFWDGAAQKFRVR